MTGMAQHGLIFLCTAGGQEKGRWVYESLGLEVLAYIEGRNGFEQCNYGVREGEWWCQEVEPGSATKVQLFHRASERRSLCREDGAMKGQSSRSTEDF
jgi:hypothetical protein